MRRMPGCGICHDIIDANDNDDVTLIDDEKLADHWRIALMANQGALGSMYITSREHRGDLDQLTTQEMGDLMEIARVMTNALKTKFGATHINFVCDMNDAAAEGTPTHIHFKLRGRYNHPVTVDGEEFVDTYFGTKRIEPHYVGRHTLHVIRNTIESAYYEGEY